MFGNEAKGAHQYEGKEYVGFSAAHSLNKYIDCHDVHALEPKLEACAGCHGDVPPEEICFNTNTTNWDGDVTEGMSSEIRTLTDALYVPCAAGASHACGNCHWGRTSNPATITVINSMTSGWDDNLVTAVSDWHRSSVLNIVQEAGSDDVTTRSRCRAVKGMVRLCNYTYRNNGCLGLAQIWVRGSHITRGTAKMSDAYLASGFNKTNKQHMTGHGWGFGRQDES